MNIPQIDQDLATIKAMHIQHENGYHISEADYKQFRDAFYRLTAFKMKMMRELT
jgi:PHD/YefM family antitoxin component YafN of YafNO toxin-antitoxin module